MKKIGFRILKKAFRLIRNIIFAVLDTGYISVGDSNEKCLRLFGYMPKRAKAKINNEKLIYFKVNNVANIRLICIQHWINIAYELGYQFIFVCDNNYAKYKIVRKCRFHKSSDINFMKSLCNKKVRKVSRNLYTGHWEFVTYAHLTPFYDARKKGINKFWCIDADDTIILTDANKASTILKEAENISLNENINAFSLDMWRSRTFGVHWSLGVLYINDTVDFCKIFESNKDLQWAKSFENYTVSVNLDWFISFLKNKQMANINTFYFENTYFMHFGDMLRHTSNSGIYIWKDNYLEQVFLNRLYKNKALGTVPIADCIKLPVLLEEDDSLKFIENELSNDRYLPIQIKNLQRYRDFAINERSIKLR